MSLKTIKIFLASALELKEDREKFRQFISVENERLVPQNLFLHIVQYEYFTDAMSRTRMQSEYNNAIRECDILLCLFFTKVGKYTEEEFDTAYQVFKETGKPLIWTYFKDAPISAGLITDDIASMLAFKKKIGDLGHFHTVYTNIDNLNYQFRNQLDKVLPKLYSRHNGAPGTAGNAVAPAGESVKNTFNEKLTRRILEAIQVYSPRAAKFLENATRMAPDWETQSRFSDPAKEIIAFSLVGVIGIQLRKLMAIGKEEFSQYKINKYVENCRLTCKRTLQLLCFALLSRLWDYTKENNVYLSPEQATTCHNFFNDEFEWDIPLLIRLLKTLIDMYAGNNLSLPLSELNNTALPLEEGSPFVAACHQLQATDKVPGTATFNLDDCAAAEDSIATVLAAVAFLANYKMVSIKSIGYFEMRNSKPHYLYNYTSLGVDIKSNINQERINYAEAPITTDAVLLYKGTYQQHVNLFPFVIDINALTVEGGAKICFYACNDNRDGSLNYNFLEDNSTVNIADTHTLKPGVDINEVLMDVKKRKDMRLDAVFALFGQARSAITGVEAGEAYENPF